MLLGSTMEGFGYLVVAVLSGWWIYRDLNRRGWASVAI